MFDYKLVLQEFNRNSEINFTEFELSIENARGVNIISDYLLLHPLVFVDESCEIFVVKITIMITAACHCVPLSVQYRRTGIKHSFTL